MGTGLCLYFNTFSRELQVLTDNFARKIPGFVPPPREMPPGKGRRPQLRYLEAAANFKERSSIVTPGPSAEPLGARPVFWLGFFYYTPFGGGCQGGILLTWGEGRSIMALGIAETATARWTLGFAQVPEISLGSEGAAPRFAGVPGNSALTEDLKLPIT